MVLCNKIPYNKIKGGGGASRKKKVNQYVPSIKKNSKGWYSILRSGEKEKKSREEIERTRHNRENQN